MKRRPPCLYPLRRWLCAAGALLFIAAAPLIPAQETEPPPPEPKETERPFTEILPRFKNQAVVLQISARVVEQNQEVVWHEAHEKVTIPGRPVGLKLVGANVVVAVQFTPYLRRKGKNLLVAQGQIWVNVPNQGISYQTSMQTIPLEFDEPVYFFPLGQHNEGDSAFIEVMLTLHPYNETAIPKEDGSTANLPAGENR
ncbi:MAG: hypothetical protein LBD48_11130 [Treponema sp.]|jgi:hypothetical protein|nr:hypothetical protein [Treponema sp.]